MCVCVRAVCIVCGQTIHLAHELYGSDLIHYPSQLYPILTCEQMQPNMIHLYVFIAGGNNQLMCVCVCGGGVSQ